ncbi:hypothetical protein A1O7_04289 [Cladophialophora yegresii CBS 114405]|uniref:CENP-V/GFA domain-containing protein n=1 Tax=Cladophialophora yegresii CBS 114405 TaxID=1182544 RepID=W9VWC3_9EURO|nr:uncharacterized protein A1O7_04289 [Cladophialophora yegresii CBS 114405]EXJ60137.1 hypothetical protein A1O7_04289 [Cladophialophora yegresii CBS 114405]
MTGPATTPKDWIDRGHCLCRAVTFTVTGPPIYTVICHCENCKRQGGSTLHCASIYPRQQYALAAGSERYITTYTDGATQSGQPLYRAFCSVCGSKVFAKTPLNEQIISIPAGVLSGRAGRDWTPSKEQFCAERCGWVPELGTLVADKDRFAKGPTGDAVRQVLAKL